MSHRRERKDKKKEEKEKLPPEAGTFRYGFMTHQSVGDFFKDRVRYNMKRKYERKAKRAERKNRRKEKLGQQHE